MTVPAAKSHHLSHPANPDRPASATRLRADLIATVASVVMLCAIAIPRIFSTPPWIDESYTVAATEHLSESVTFSHYTMSGYYAVLWIWGQLSTSIIWLRMFSLLCAILTIICVRRLAILIGGRRLATLAVLVVPFLAMFQWKATEARAYALETLVVAVCWLIVLTGRLESVKSRWWWLLLGIVGVFGEFLHGMFGLQILPISLYLVLRDRRRVTMVRALLLAAVPAATAWLLWSNGADHVGTLLAGGPATWLGSFFEMFLGHAPVVVVATLLGVTWWIAAALRSTDRNGRRRPVTTWVPVLWVSIPVIGLGAISLVVNRFNPRYLAPILPGLAILFAQVGVWLDRVIGRQQARSPRKTSAPRLPGRLGSVLVVGLVIAGSIATPPFVVSPWKEVVHRVANAEPTGTCIIFAELSDTHPAQIRTPFETAWRIYGTDHPPTVISSDRQLGSPHRFDPNLTSEEVANRARACLTVWVLSDGGFGTDPGERFRALRPFSNEFDETSTWTTADGYRLTELRRLPTR